MVLQSLEAFFRGLSDEELQAYRATAEDYRDRILADEEFARRTTPPWLKVLRALVGFTVGLVMHPGILLGLGVTAFMVINPFARTLSLFGLMFWAGAYVLLMLCDRGYTRPALLRLAVGMYAVAAAACAISVAIVLRPFIVPR